MAVLPGSLDYLYYNGILDHIPYEAYEGYGQGYAGTMNSGMNNQQMLDTQYLNSAKQGILYNTYTDKDSFVKRNNSNYSVGENYSFTQTAFGIGSGRNENTPGTNSWGSDGKSFRQSIMDAASQTKETVTNSPSFIKGLLGAGIIALTLFAVIKKGKKK